MSAEDRALCEAMREAAFSHKLVRAALMHAADREISVFWEDGGVKQKARVDALADGLVLDLKTTVDASASAFRSAVARYRYHVQAAHYSAGVHRATGVWPDYALVAIEKSPPYGCAVYMLDEDALRSGEILRERAVRRYLECVEKDEWPSYKQVTQVISLPGWAIEEGWE